MTTLEEEIIVLKDVNEIIHSMVNYEMIDLPEDDPVSNIMFKSSVHQKLFNITLTDFLSKFDPSGPVNKESYLGAIKKIIENPSFNLDDSIASLQDATYKFAKWLEEEITVQGVWFPSINVKTDIKVKRISFIKMCGCITKHSFLKSSGIANDLKKLLKDNGINLTSENALLALGDFYEWFHTDILNYLGTIICEFLNNIRWGVHEYLQPEFRRSFSPDKEDRFRYEYLYPDVLNSDFAKACYWDLMNEIRNGPSLREFVMDDLLKSRY